MNQAYLLTGGNMGNRRENLAKAFDYINEECGLVTKASSVYETAAWGKNDQPPFLNQVLEIETTLTAQQLLRKILMIEKKLGRVREEKYGPRIIDIDILLFNNEVYDLPALKVPHPELQNRRFVLVPLAEIAGEIIHPIFKKTITTLLAICPDKLEVSAFPV
ncbi:2-amino-4-hydroxy-6-hydroxymethyldihydropteridine diphosphokinase [Terrimonas pollutisoli]|uniref:2-amino-4-hydroxy-6- hydroxymethyldihydropteridine diphosphokinase n=1 Tax=Terrimonas pollutisoli TaxID=3034147 RepID=UPI0023EB3216|nr:2-amino-4-hydroxy-6-hydroxymethyldihydropteridine diphosphokinase [Terrimonas sp. H1YJ31]